MEFISAGSLGCGWNTGALRNYLAESTAKDAEVTTYIPDYISVCRHNLIQILPGQVDAVDIQNSLSHAVKNVEKGEKSPERIDVVGLKLYLRRFRIRLYS